MAKKPGAVKNSGLVPKTSPRDSQADLDTVLVVSSDEIEKARAAVESVTSETATIDCHPVILDDTEDATERLVGSDASSSGLVTKPVEKPPKRDLDDLKDGEDTATISAPRVATLVDVDEDEEEIELSLSGEISPIEGTPTRETIALAAKVARQESSATITELREVPKGSRDDDTATEARKPVPRFDDETMPMPKPAVGDIAGALETVPLNAALVQNVIAQVDARSAARGAGQPVPAFHLSPVNPQLQMPPQQQQHQPQQPRQNVPQSLQATAPRMQAPPRRLGIEIVITLFAFLLVAVPALYVLYVKFMM